MASVAVLQRAQWPTLFIYYKLAIFICFHKAFPRENEVREHIPVPYDNLFQSIFVFAPRCEKYI